MGIAPGEASEHWDTADLAAYALTPPLTIAPLTAGAGINNRVRVVRTGAGQFLWKGYLTHADPARILAEHRLLGWLAGASLPFGTPRPLATRNGETLRPSPAGTGWQALFPWLPGTPLDRRDPDTIAALGAALGVLHGALAALPADLCPTWASNGTLAAIHPRVPNPATLTPRDLGLPDGAPHRAALAEWRATVRELDLFLNGPYPDLPHQAIHGDFGPGNALADGARIIATLDFEFALWDTRALDVASGLWMVTRIWEWSPPASLAMAAAFCAGYARTAQLTPAEIAALPQLMLLRVMVGTVWWLGRDLAAGDARPALGRLADLRELRGWLATHEGALLDAVAAALN